MRPRRSVLLIAPLLACASAMALDFRTVGAAPAVLYSAPSAKATRQFVVPSGAPLEVLISYGEWVKVRDMNGDQAWTEARALTGKQRNVIVRSGGAKVRAAADEAAAVIFSADKGVLLELVEAAGNGWTRVRHRDGQAGFVRSSDIWGN